MKLLYRIVIALTRFVFKVFYRLQIYGSQNYLKGGAILAPNHVSYLDPPIVAAASSEEIHFLARSTLFRSFFGRLISSLNAHPVQGRLNNLKAIKTICELLKKGHKVLLFPEGTRSQSRQLGEIKPGIGVLLSKSKTAIIPIYIHGTFEIWNRTRRYPSFFGQTAVVFGSPIQWSDYVDLDKKRAYSLIAADLKDSLERLHQWYESGAKGTPP